MTPSSLQKYTISRFRVQLKLKVQLFLFAPTALLFSLFRQIYGEGL